MQQLTQTYGLISQVPLQIGAAYGMPYTQVISYLTAAAELSFLLEFFLCSNRICQHFKIFVLCYEGVIRDRHSGKYPVEFFALFYELLYNFYLRAGTHESSMHYAILQVILNTKSLLSHIATTNVVLAAQCSENLFCLETASLGDNR